MQVAKNLFLLPTKSYLRKIVEIPLTFAIELAWPKWRILEIYLNIVEWGPGRLRRRGGLAGPFRPPGLRAEHPRRRPSSPSVLPNPIVRDAGAPGPRTAHRASVIQARAAATARPPPASTGAVKPRQGLWNSPPECEYKAPHVAPRRGLPCRAFT